MIPFVSFFVKDIFSTHGELFTIEKPEYVQSNIEGNITRGIVIGATPRFYASWSISSKLFLLASILMSFITNSVVVALYIQVRRKVTMHEIHVFQLAVVDLLATSSAIVPAIGGNILSITGDEHQFSMPCFMACLFTLSFDVMAMAICNLISYDRLRLLQLGIRYHLVHTRVFSIARLIFIWTTMVCLTITCVVIIVVGPIATQSKEEPCQYTLSTDWFMVKLFLTLIAVGPLLSLVTLNCLVRSKLRQLEERHPHVINRTRTSSLARGPKASGGDTDPDSQVFWTASAEATSTGGGVSAFQSEEQIADAQDAQEPQEPPDPALYKGSTLSATKSLLRSFKSERSLSRRATASIFLSTATFILCLSPLSALLLTEAWFPDAIENSVHRWHLWLTLLRTTVDPFLFARSVPSFRLQYGTTILKWENRWRWFHKFRALCIYVTCYMDMAAVDDARERMDRKKRVSPAQLRIGDKISGTFTPGEVTNASAKNSCDGQEGSYHEPVTDRLSLALRNKKLSLGGTSV